MTYQITRTSGSGPDPSPPTPTNQRMEYFDPITTLNIRVYPGGRLFLSGIRKTPGGAEPFVSIDTEYTDRQRLYQFLDDVLDIDIAYAATLQPNQPQTPDGTPLPDED